MPRALVLRVRHAADGDLRVAVGRPAESAAEAVVSREVLAAARAACAPPRAARVVVASDAARMAEAERAAGQALAALIAASPEVAHRFSARLGALRGEGAVLTIDAVEPDLRALPWELLASLETGQVMAATEPGLRVVRLGPGQAAPRVGDRARMLLAALDPDDDVIAGVLASRRALAERLGLELVPLGASTPARAEGALDLLHLVAHGHRSATALHVLASGGGAPPEAPVFALQSAIAAADAVILEICDASAPAGPVWEDLAHRCLLAGAPVVIAPCRPALVRAQNAFVEALYGALLEEIPWSEAVGRGHQAIAGLSLALPQARWWTLLEHRAGLGDGEPLRLDRGALRGLPPLHAEVMALLQAGAALAEADGRGFLGLEHLGRAAAGTVRLAGRSGALGPALLRAAPDLQLAALALARHEAGGVRRTPRLDAVLAGLPPGADLDALWWALTGCGGPLDSLGHLLAVAPDGRTVGSMGGSTVGSRVGSMVGGPRLGGAPIAAALPERLELVGGPEDGRLLAPAPGETLGRSAANGEADHRFLADERVSRRHLRWLGPGRVWSSHRLERTRRGQTERLPAGEVSLAVGDLLRLGAAPVPLLRALEAT